MSDDKKEINSLSDIFADDDLGILSDGDNSIFKIRHVSKKINQATDVAKRKKCKNFDVFEHLFIKCHAQLKSGIIKTERFVKEEDINAGTFFILNGVICYVDTKGEQQEKNGRTNYRLHLVFENGTESNMLLRSLSTALSKDDSGRIVIPATKVAVDDDDASSGFIYVLSSLSQKPDLASINNLFKIGYSTTPIEKRIANAENEVTYLMAPVKIEAAYQCFNMNTQKFESLLHNFFGDTCLEIEIADRFGKLCQPREWFIAPLDAVDNAVQLIISGEIVHYKYDVFNEEFVRIN